MRTAKVKGTGGKFHWELSEGSCSVRIYSSTQKKQGRTYQTHFLTYFEGGERKRVGYAKLDDAKAQAELVLLRLPSTPGGRTVRATRNWSAIMGVRCGK